jgi:integrase
MLPQVTHIARKRGVYYYRRRLPRPLVGEITLSLRTRSFRRAEWLAQGLDGAFETAMSRTDGPSKADAAVRAYLKRLLDDDFKERIARPNEPLYPEISDGRSPQASDLEWIDAELEASRVELANRRYDAQRPLIEELMELEGVPEDQRDSFAHGVLRARVEFFEEVRKRTLGEFPPISDAHMPLARLSPERPTTREDGPLFSAVLPKFLDEMTTREGWRGQTLMQNTTTYRLFVDHCGDKPVRSYGRTDLASFREALLGLPTTYGKGARWKKLSMGEVLTLARDQSLPTITMKTAKRHFSALGRLFDYMRTRGDYEAENPARGHRFPKKGRARDQRMMWEGERLTRLFSTPVWAGCASRARRSQPGRLVLKDERYWLPILGLYHGNRLEEFAQLRREDVRCEDGIWFVDINDGGDRQLKNAQSKRRVPLHPRVQGLGFLGYVEQTAPKPSDPVFPALKPGGPDKKLGFSFTKWWSTYRRDVGVYEKGLDYHSLRHGVTTKLYAAGVTEAIVDELTGHEGQGTSRTTYKKSLPLRVLLEAIAKVEWPEVDDLLR